MSESVAFGQKLWYFTDQNEQRGGPHKNKFRKFSNLEMNVTVRESTSKKGSHLSSFHIPFFSYGTEID